MYFTYFGFRAQEWNSILKLNDYFPISCSKTINKVVSIKLPDLQCVSVFGIEKSEEFFFLILLFNYFLSANLFCVALCLHGSHAQKSIDICRSCFAEL